MRPRLSVVIPSRNGLDTLPRAVASALALPVEELEIVVVDDGSTDGTGDWLAQQGKLDPRVIGLRRDKDHGVSAARNAGIAAARAPVLAFLDADDVWFPDPVAERLRWHERHPDTVLSFANYQTLLPDGRRQDRYLAYTPRFWRFIGGRDGIISLEDKAFPLLAGENPVCTSSVMVSREAVLAVGGFDAGLRQAEDWDLWIRLAKRGPVAASTAIELLHADRPGSLSHKVAERVACLRDVVGRHQRDVWRRSPAAALAAKCLLAQAEAELAIRQGRQWSALAHMAAAMTWQPSRQHFRDAARAGLVVLGLKPPLPVSHDAA